MARMPNLASLIITIYTHSSLGLLITPAGHPCIKNLTVLCRGLEIAGQFRFPVVSSLPSTTGRGFDVDRQHYTPVGSVCRRDMDFR